MVSIPIWITDIIIIRQLIFSIFFFVCLMNTHYYLLLLLGTLLSLHTGIYSEVFPQWDVNLSPVILCIHAIPSSWNALCPFTSLERYHSFINATPSVALVEAWWGSTWLSDQLSHFASCPCPVNCLHTKHQVNHSCSLPSQKQGDVFSGQRLHLCTPSLGKIPWVW